MLRSRAGYRSARPIISRSSHSACNARPVHTKVPGARGTQPVNFVRKCPAVNQAGSHGGAEVERTVATCLFACSGFREGGIVPWEPLMAP
jgi:hypothetical protein